MHTASMTEHAQKTVQDKERLRSEHIQNCIAAIEQLGPPQLESVRELERQSPVDGITYTSVEITNTSIDPRIIPTLLQACGVSEWDQRGIEVSLRTARLADKDASGAPIGGVAIGNYIEAYTAAAFESYLPDDAAARSFSLSVFSFKSEHAADFIVHELRHIIQHILELFDVTSDSFFASSEEAHDAIDFEQDAIQFSAAISPLLERYIEIKHDEIFEKKGVEAINKLRKLVTDGVNEGVLGYFDLTKMSQLYETDPPALIIDTQIRSLLSNESFDGSRLIACITLIKNNFIDAQRQAIGYAEVRHFLNALVAYAEKHNQTRYADTIRKIGISWKVLAPPTSPAAPPAPVSG